jgi:rare lipoprotein A (peptidoglycan hydrolase)
MVVVLMGALFSVRESAPSDVHLEASGASGSDRSVDAATADRLAHALPIRASRSEAQARTFLRANDEPTTTTTAAPTTTTSTTARPTTTTTARPKVVVTTTTTAKPKPTTTTTARPTTTTAAPTTTTTARPTTTSTMGPPPPCCRQEGGASYYDYSDPRMCAHKSLPKGTALTVTNLANGKQTTCVVGDRGPYVDGRILDLSKTAFSEIASLSDGVIRVSIEWSA